MPAYSFKERFVPYVMDGSKTHTIRSRRKHPAKINDTLYLYFGLRTKWCSKLREEPCTDVRTIIITAKGTVYLYKARLDENECESLKANPSQYPVPLLDANWQILTMEQKNRLAWMDGFRPVSCSLNNPGNAFDLMLRFWRQMHDLPFIGDLIFWNPLIEPFDGAFCD